MHSIQYSYLVFDFFFCLKAGDIKGTTCDTKYTLNLAISLSGLRYVQVCDTCSLFVVLRRLSTKEIFDYL